MKIQLKPQAIRGHHAVSRNGDHFRYPRATNDCLRTFLCSIKRVNITALILVYNVYLIKDVLYVTTQKRLPMLQKPLVVRDGKGVQERFFCKPWHWKHGRRKREMFQRLQKMNLSVCLLNSHYHLMVLLMAVCFGTDAANVKVISWRYVFG